MYKMRKKLNDIYEKYNVKWTFFITLWTFILAILFSLITEKLLADIDIILGFLVLIVIIFIGIFFDIIGIAVTVLDEKPFHSMAANKVKGAKQAVKLIRNAGQVSNFCNDVIGDVSGIVSGGIGTSIVYKLVSRYDISITVMSIFITAVIAALTVGGKALGKEIAILNAKEIIFNVAKFLNFIEDKFNINLLPDIKKKE